MRKIVSAADFKEFGQGESYSGKFVRPVLRDADHPTDSDKKKGDLMGYLFEDYKGEETIIGASHSITKALTAESEGVGNFYQITFIEKVQLEKGKSFNRYDVQAYDNEQEFRTANDPAYKTLAANTSDSLEKPTQGKKK